MILTWMLPCLSLVAAFPKGYNRGQTDPLQTGSSITTRTSSQTRPPPVPWKPFPFFKKSSLNHSPWRPSGSSGTAVQAAIRRPVKSSHVNSRPPPVPVHPWVIPIHGHPPTQRIIVLTGNNVFSLNPKGSSLEKITQLFLTSGNSGISLHSSGCSLGHGCTGMASHRTDLPKLHSGMVTKQVELPVIKANDETAIESVLTDLVEIAKGDDLVPAHHEVLDDTHLVELVTEDDLVFVDHGETSDGTGVLEGNIVHTQVIPSAVFVEKVIEDSVDSGKDQVDGGAIEVEEFFAQNLEDVSEADKPHDVIVVFQSEESIEPPSGTVDHANFERIDLNDHLDPDILELAEANDHETAAETLQHSNAPDIVAVDGESEETTGEILADVEVTKEHTVQKFLADSSTDLEAAVGVADAVDASVEVDSENQKVEVLPDVNSENVADHHILDDDFQNTGVGVAVPAEDLKDIDEALESADVDVESEKTEIDHADNEGQASKVTVVSIDLQAQSKLEEDIVEILDSTEQVNEGQKDANLVFIEDINLLDELLDRK